MAVRAKRQADGASLRRLVYCRASPGVSASVQRPSIVITMAIAIQVCRATTARQQGSRAAGQQGSRAVYSSSMCAPRSPIMMLAALVLADTILGITDASITRKPSTPRTLSCGSTTAAWSAPIRQVLVG